MPVFRTSWFRWLAAAALLAAPPVTHSAFAEDPAAAAAPTTEAGNEDPDALGLSYDATLASNYIFQGFDYSYGRSVVQPNATATWRGFSANAWGNLQAGSLALNEVDLSIKYAHEAGKLSAAAGYLNLRYPNRDWEPSQEFFVDVAYTAPLNPSLSVHYDFGAGDGAYTTLGLRHELPNQLSFGTNLYVQSHYYGMTGLCSAEFKLSASHSLGTATLTQSASYFRTWENGDFRDDGAIPSKWLVAINVSR
jgi:hypothetical protein